MEFILSAIFMATCASIGVSLGAGISFWSVEIPLTIISSLLAIAYNRKISKEIEEKDKQFEKKRELFNKTSKKDYDILTEKYNKRLDEYKNSPHTIEKDFNNQYYIMEYEDIGKSYYAKIDEKVYLTIDENIYAMVENNKIMFLYPIFDEYEYIKSNIPIPKEYKEESFNLDDIKYYQIIGSHRNEQYISGGGGGGSSIKGAVIGGLIAGDVGAIIGSRKKTEEITTEYKEIDDRELKIIFKDNKELIMCFDFYEFLLDYIPDKEYDTYIENKKNKGKEN